MEARFHSDYPRQSLFGLFLCLVSLALFLPVAFPYQGQLNGALFGVCYAAAFAGVMINPVLRSRYPTAGNASPALVLQSRTGAANRRSGADFGALHR